MSVSSLSPEFLGTKLFLKGRRSCFLPRSIIKLVCSNARAIVHNSYPRNDFFPQEPSNLSSSFRPYFLLSLKIIRKEARKDRKRFVLRSQSPFPDYIFRLSSLPAPNCHVCVYYASTGLRFPRIFANTRVTSPRDIWRVPERHVFQGSLWDSGCISLTDQILYYFALIPDEASTFKPVP